MARKYELRDHVITKKDNQLVECTCDLCGKSDGGPWDDFYYHAEFGDKVEVIVRLKEGTLRDTGNGHYVEKEYDVCADCFKSKIMPIFKGPPREDRIGW